MSALLRILQASALFCHAPWSRSRMQGAIEREKGEEMCAYIFIASLESHHLACRNLAVVAWAILLSWPNMSPKLLNTCQPAHMNQHAES